MAHSNTLTRVLTALVLIPLVIGVVLWAPQSVFAGLVLLVALLALREYLDLAQKSGANPLRAFAYASVILLLVWLPPAEIVGLLVLVALLLVMRAARPLTGVLPDAAATILGCLYIGLPLAMLADIRLLRDGPKWVIYLLGLIWISDTAAYFAGRSFGRRKLAPRISPGKTWEGTAASLLAAVLFGTAYIAYWLPGTPWSWSLVASVLVNVAGQAGDLAESALKRGAGLKDSSAILPGHGGMLDRIDALLFAAPTLWYILSMRAPRFLASLQ